jgi:hypothetical protein
MAGVDRDAFGRDDEEGQGAVALDSCGACRFWRREGSRRAGWGQCRRLPPALPAVRTDKLKLVGVWPVTEERDWCGEWRSAAGGDESGRDSPA